MGGAGFAPPLKTPMKTADSDLGGAKSGAPSTPDVTHDPDLARLVMAWSGLPSAIRKAMLTMLEALSRSGITEDEP